MKAEIQDRVSRGIHDDLVVIRMSDGTKFVLIEETPGELHVRMNEPFMKRLRVMPESGNVVNLGALL
jgi:hypothetical protein